MIYEIPWDHCVAQNLPMHCNDDDDDDDVAVDVDEDDAGGARVGG